MSLIWQICDLLSLYAWLMLNADWDLQNFRVFSVYRHFQLIHFLNKRHFEHLHAC